MSRTPQPLWRIEIQVPTPTVDAFEEALADLVDSVSSFADGDIDEAVTWTVQAIARTRPDAAELTARLALMAASQGVAAPAPAIEMVPAKDWVLENLQSFPPMRAGRYFIHGSHFDGRVPHGHIGLEVDAGIAFGSGEHPTTRGCLLALDRLARHHRIHSALDMGCGSGILAIAMAKTWHVPVVASDLDPASARVAARNARINRAAAWVSAFQADGYRHRRVAAAAPYGLITANILARPLCRMAPDLARHLAPGGMAVLSGLLLRQGPQVLSAHRRQGLVLVARIAVSGWLTLVLARPR